MNITLTESELRFFIDKLLVFVDKMKTNQEINDLEVLSDVIDRLTKKKLSEMTTKTDENNELELCKSQNETLYEQIVELQATVDHYAARITDLGSGLL